MNWLRLLLMVSVLLPLTGCMGAEVSGPAIGKSFYGPDPQGGTPAGYLASVMDRYHAAFYVYTDADAAGNHFVARGQTSSPGDEDTIPAMDEAWTGEPYEGITCIKCTFQSNINNWGGWIFLNGVLEGDEVAPKENWGEYADAGIGLRGATTLSFCAKGENGGEWVEFYAFGVGRHPDTGDPLPGIDYPGSSPKCTLGWVQLTSDWQHYELDVNQSDLSYILGGFAWVTNAPMNGNQDIAFYLDEINYDKPRLSEPRFLVSYKTIQSDLDFDKIHRNASFTYDNALALTGFIASGNYYRAKLIVDALAYAKNFDRYYDDSRIRNAYQGGDLVLFPGWEPNGRKYTVRMPGWNDTEEEKWVEDMLQVSSHTGNVAWAMLALINIYETILKNGPYITEFARTRYIDAARAMGEWVQSECYDGEGIGGYFAGYNGWEPDAKKITYKSTEHNIDLYVAFHRLYTITRDPKWLERSNHARDFVIAMWDDTEGKFWPGTKDDGQTPNIDYDTIPLDVQAWAVLALKEEGSKYWAALDYVEEHHKVGDGYDFNTDKDGIWWEGTAQMAAAYLFTGQQAKYDDIMAAIETAGQDDTGGVFAAGIDGLTTGFELPALPDQDPQPWLYYHRLHIGATAWFLIAKRKLNPFWMCYMD